MSLPKEKRRSVATSISTRFGASPSASRCRCRSARATLSAAARDMDRGYDPDARPCRRFRVCRRRRAGWISGSRTLTSNSTGSSSQPIRRRDATRTSRFRSTQVQRRSSTWCWWTRRGLSSRCWRHGSLAGGTTERQANLLTEPNCMKLIALVCCLGLSVAACGDDPERRSPLPQPSPLPPEPGPTPPTPTPPGPSAVSTGPIAFVSTRDGSPSIYLANADGTAATRLTSGEKAAWSRDGRSLAFQRGGGIFVINADGSGERWLGSGRSPDWSPDGTRIVFAAGKAPGGIFVMNADGSGQTMLLSSEFVQPGDGIHTPAWSPDGRRIAFVRANFDEPWQIYVMNADGSEPRRLLNGFIPRQAEPAWSPDGSMIAYETYNGIAVLNVNSPEWNPGGVGFDPDWLPDGRSLGVQRLHRAPWPGVVPWLADEGLRQERELVRQLVPDAVDPTCQTTRTATWRTPGSMRDALERRARAIASDVASLNQRRSRSAQRLTRASATTPGARQ